MKANILTIKFEPKWILENQQAGASRVIEDVLKVIKNHCEDNAGIFIIEKEFHKCSLIIACEGEVDKNSVNNYIRSELSIIKEDTLVDVAIEEIDEAELKEKVNQISFKLSDDEIAFLNKNFHFKIEKEGKPEDNDNVSEEHMDINELIGLEPLKQWVAETNLVAEKYKDMAINARMFKNMLMLLSINRGNGLTTILEIMARTLKATQFVEFIGKNDFIEWNLKYSEGSEEFASFEGLLMKINRCERGTNFKGIVAVNIEEWIDHLTDRRFENFLEFVWGSKTDIFFVFVVPYIDDDVLGMVQARLNDIMNIKTLKFIPPSDKEYFKYFSELFKKFNVAVEDEVINAFITKITNEKNDGRFYSFNTVKKIADEVLYKLIVNAATKGEDIPKSINAEMFSEYYSLEGASNVSGLEQLQDMIALENVKSKVQEIISTVKFQKEMYKSGTGEIKPCLHMMFTGNPGTGKTVVARIIGRIFKEEGILPIGNFFEVSRKDFIGKFVGHTAPKTMEICRNAVGSVLFIDEAYTLADDRDGYSSEAIGTLIAEMENNRDKMVVIFAGYEKELEGLLEMNPGLKDRIPYKIDFPNYNREELKQIFFKNIDKKMKADEKFKLRAEDFFKTFPDEIMQMKDFSNGRFVRNLSERIISKAALRFELTDKDIMKFELTDTDFDAAVADNDFKKLFSKPMKSAAIGF